MMSRSRAADEWVDLRHSQSDHQALRGRLSPCNDKQIPDSHSGDLRGKDLNYQLVALVRVKPSYEEPQKFPVYSKQNSELPPAEMSTTDWPLLHFLIR